MDTTTDNARSSSITKPQRLYYLDWLRVLAVLLLLYVHVSDIFNLEFWLIKSPHLSVALELFNSLVKLWRLPLLFLVSGAGTFFALGMRSGREYAVDRLKRLLIPLIFGTLVLIPPQIYYERIGFSDHRPNLTRFDGSFFQFYPHFFEGVYPNGNWSWLHLWFLAYLLVFSLVALPLLLALRTSAGQGFISRLAAFCSRGPAILLLALPLIVSEVVLRTHRLWGLYIVDDWSNATIYFIIFIYGYLLYADARFAQAIVRNRKLALSLGIAMMLFLALQGDQGRAGEGYSLAYVIRQTAMTFTRWCMLVAIVGFAQAYLNKPGKLLNYASEIVPPFYIWHQTVVVVIGFYVVRTSGPMSTVIVPLDGPIIVHFFVISTAALVVTLLLCELVKQTNLTRMLFGMKPRKQTSAPPIELEPLSVQQN